MEDLASARVLIFLDDLRCLIAISVDLCFLGYGLASSVFDNCLLAYRLSHPAASESTEAAGLETGKAATVAKASSEEIVIVHLHHHAEWVSTLLLLLHLSLLAALTLTSHAALHLIKQAGATERRLAKSTSKKVVIIVEEASKRVVAIEELTENIVRLSHVEVSGMESGGPTVASIGATTARRMPALLEKLAAVSVVILSFLCVTKNAICVRDLLKDFFCLLLVVRVLVRMVLERKFLVGLLNLRELSVSRHAEHLIKVLRVEVWT